MSRGRLDRSRKPRAGTEILCERVFRPVAHLVVLALLPLRVPPPAVVAASGAAGIAGAVALARGHLVAAALLVQLKTVLDNADGQLARLTGRASAFGRYLDSEMDLVVNAALFAGLGAFTGSWPAALGGFLALTAVLGVNFNAERLYRAERGADGSAMPAAESRPAAVLRRVYELVYAPQDRLVERFVARRLRGAPAEARLAYHDRATVSILANLGMSTQLAVLGICLVAGRPLAFVWIVLAELGLVAALACRRELLLRGVVHLPEEAL
ncbi:MAG TPA: CDP-alcohol phosphatidyltransferase family protein [Gaiellaceae bacterium]|nr:CDP-alcohol phosphatidyltransferase family protein [Gaiellaceae bacterium]